MAVTLSYSRSIVGTITKRLTVSVYRSVQEARHFISLSSCAYSPEAPKKPSGPYMKFLKERYPDIQKNNPGCSFGEASKIASQLWHSLGPEQQNAYKLHAREELKDYKQKYLRFLDGLSEQEKAENKDYKGAKRLAHREESERLGKPKRPPSAYALFLQSLWPEQGNRSFAQFMKDLADSWQNLPTEEKEIYKEDFRAKRQKYLKEMEEWEKRMREIGQENIIRKNHPRAEKALPTKAGEKTPPSGKRQKQESTSPKSQRKITEKSTVSEESKLYS